MPSLRAFAEAIEAKLHDLLLQHRFSLVVRDIQVAGFSLIFRADKRYVAIGASLDPRDEPYVLSCAFGEGPHQWPDADWNQVPLWRLIRQADPQAAEQLLWSLAYNAELSAEQCQAVSGSCREALLLYGRGFLTGNLTDFLLARRELNSVRQPYKMASRAPDGSIITRLDEASERLRAKYMQ